MVQIVGEHSEADLRRSLVHILYIQGRSSHFVGVTNSWCEGVPRAQTFWSSADDCVVVDVV